MTREKAIEILKEIIDEGWLISDFEKCVAIDACEMAIKALKQEPRKDEVILTKKEYGELVSSEFENGYAKGYREAMEQETETGHWILLDECADSGYYCSKCHKKVVKEGWSDTVKKIKYCPNCGAEMEDEDDRD